MKIHIRQICVVISLGLIFATPVLLAQDITKVRSIEQFFRKNTELRVSGEAVEAYKTTLNELSLKVLKKAETLVKKNKRKTILGRDIDKAADDVLRRSPISVSEIMEKITQLPMIDMVELNNQIKTYGDKLLEEKK